MIQLRCEVACETLRQNHKIPLVCSTEYKVARSGGPDSPVVNLKTKRARMLFRALSWGCFSLNQIDCGKRMTRVYLVVPKASQHQNECTYREWEGWKD